jgi:hypothetical protein
MTVECKIPNWAVFYRQFWLKRESILLPYFKQVGNERTTSSFLDRNGLLDAFYSHPVSSWERARSQRDETNDLLLKNLRWQVLDRRADKLGFQLGDASGLPR